MTLDRAIQQFIEQERYIPCWSRCGCARFESLRDTDALMFVFLAHSCERIDPERDVGIGPIDNLLAAIAKWRTRS